MPYGLAVGYDARASDVGVVQTERWNAIPEDYNLLGSPDLVVQVKSPSDRDRKMEQDAIVHITHGATAVWLVKLHQREIVMVTASARTVYEPGQQIELPGIFSASIPVDEIFT